MYGETGTPVSVTSKSMTPFDGNRQGLPDKRQFFLAITLKAGVWQ